VQIGGEEQNPIRESRPWRILADRTRSRCLEWKIDDEAQFFAGEHFGYAHRSSGAICRRAVSLRPSQDEFRIEDTVFGTGMEDVTWRLQFAAGELEHLETVGDIHRYTFVSDAGVNVEVRAPGGLDPRISNGAASDRYGVMYSRPVLVMEGHVKLPVTIETSLSVDNR
jgi:hypothetical protein